VRNKPIYILIFNIEDEDYFIFSKFVLSAIKKIILKYKNSFFLPPIRILNFKIIDAGFVQI